MINTVGRIQYYYHGKYLKEYIILFSSISNNSINIYL